MEPKEKDKPAFVDVRRGVKTGSGLTKREYIAIRVLQGFCANQHFAAQGKERLAEWSVYQADALLNELEKKK